MDNDFLTNWRAAAERNAPTRKTQETEQKKNSSTQTNPVNTWAPLSAYKKQETQQPTYDNATVQAAVQKIASTPGIAKKYKEIQMYQGKQAADDMMNSLLVSYLNSSPTIEDTTEEFKYASYEDPAVIQQRRDEYENRVKESEKQTNSADYIEYTYKPGDTFGQVILDNGLATTRGLWGDDGDVAYYTKQLHDAGIWGNIPIGTKIRLKKRK